MEALTRLVSESLARHGFDRPLDYRRLQWSRWFRCESQHSFLFVPSKPGVFALAEEVTHAGADLVSEPRRMLAVTQFFEADDMAFVLDRMLSRYNPMRGRLECGRYFIRFVIVEDESQRRGIYTALNQWMHSPAGRTCGIGQDLAASLELTPATDDSQADLFGGAEMGRVIFSAHAVESASAEVATTASAADRKQPATPVAAPQESSDGAATHIQRPPVFPSGF